MGSVRDYSDFDSNTKANAWTFVREIGQARIYWVFKNENY